MMTCTDIRKYSFAVDDDGSLIGEIGDASVSVSAGQQLHEKARAYQQRHSGVSYPDALAAVRRDPANAPTVRAYAGIETPQPETVPTGMSIEEAGSLLDQAAQQLVRQRTCANYSLAFREACRRWPLIARCYAKTE